MNSYPEFMSRLSPSEAQEILQLAEKISRQESEISELQSINEILSIEVKTRADKEAQLMQNLQEAQQMIKQEKARTKKANEATAREEDKLERIRDKGRHVKDLLNRERRKVAILVLLLIVIVLLMIVVLMLVFAQLFL